MNQDTLLKKNLDNAQYDLLSKLLTTLNNDQKIWLGGYLSGVNESTGALLQILAQDKNFQTTVNQTADKPELKIFFGSRSGNAQKVANNAHKKATSLGLNASLVNLNDYNPKNIKREKYALFVVSTDGEGEPPIAAEEFYNYLMSKKAPAVKELNFSVLALGDSSYQYFCKTGKDIDERLVQLGATKFYDRVECDLDFNEPANEWIEAGLDKFTSEFSNTESSVQLGSNIAGTPATTEYSQEAPYDSPLLDKILLNGRGSSKETYHYEFSIEDSGISYTPGDSLGVYSTNDQAIVDRVLELTKVNEGDKIVVGKTEKTVREALTHNYELTRLTPPLVKAYAEIVNSSKLNKIISDPKQFEDYQWGRDFIDILEEYPVSFDNKTLFSTLRKLQPRLYSIASSYNSNPEEVHLTVSSVKYEQNKREHSGVCSAHILLKKQLNALLQD